MASPLCPSWRSATVRRLADPAQPGITTKDWTMEAPARRSERKSDGLIISVKSFPPSGILFFYSFCTA